MTFSIAARCPRTGMLGVATSSKALAAGGLVPYCRAAVGAIASQSFVNPYLGIDGLALLEQGLAAERALEKLVEADEGRDLRQVAIVDRDGRVAAYTGTRCIGWAGQVLGAGYVCLGNILVDGRIVESMAKAFETSLIEELPERLMRALAAGQEAGGDRRGKQSAGILVVGQEEYPWCDLRVDDHDDPVAELRRIFELYKREGVPFLSMMARRGDYTPGWDSIIRIRDEIERAWAKKRRLPARRAGLRRRVDWSDLLSATTLKTWPSPKKAAAALSGRRGRCPLSTFYASASPGKRHCMASGSLPACM